MTRSELYVIVLSNLIDYLKNNNIISAMDSDHLCEEIDLTHYSDATSYLMTLSSDSLLKFEKIIKVIQDGFGDTTEVSLKLQVRHYQVSDGNEERLKDFCYKTASIAVMPVKKIHIELDKNTKDIDGLCCNILDLIWLSYKDNDQDLKYFWECCTGNHKEDYFLLTNESDIDEINWRLYSYAYFCFVNEFGFKRPVVLDFNKNTPFSSPSPIFDPQNKYEQYFDAYNVMSEAKYSEDVLSRYLRMYQILEYLAYRKILAEMTTGKIKYNGFVRNIINKASKRGDSEFEELKKSLKTVFDLSTIIQSTDITDDMQSFIIDRLMVKFARNNDDSLWKVIYQLRNSIVHNKESELHFLYDNTDIYGYGIELMKLFIEKIEPEIVKVINDSKITDFEFDHQIEKLY